MRMNWKKGQTTGFRAAALFAVLGATLVWAHSPEAHGPGDAVPLEEVVLVTKVAPEPPRKAGGPLGLLGGLLGSGGGSGDGSGNLLGGLLGVTGLE